MDGLGHEVVAKGIHLDDGGHLAGIPIVVAVDATGQARRRLRLDRDDPVVRLAPQLLAQEREGQTREVGAATGAGHQDVRLVAGHRHLLHGLEPDDGLMHQHVVEHRPEGVLGVVPGGRVLDRLADGHAQRAGAIGRRGEHGPAVVGVG